MREAQDFLPSKGVPSLVSFANRRGDGSSKQNMRMNPKVSSLGFTAPSQAAVDEDREEEKAENDFSQ
jgi:hypothetical protein